MALIEVRLFCDKLGGAWEEDTETEFVSRYGALLQCSKRVKSGENLQIMRSDTGQKVQARVVWQRPAEGGFLTGVEFVDCDNFWGLDWSAIEDAR